jgi:hypothetical protein
MKSETKARGIVELVLKAVALAMGVATVVLSILGATEARTLVLLLGIGLAALGLVGLMQTEEV